MTIYLTLGSCLGIGLWALAVYLLPPRPALGTVLNRATAAVPPTSIEDDRGWAARLGAPAVAPLRALGLPGHALTRDLSIIGRTPATHLAEQATLAVGGLLAPSLLTAMLTLAGLGPGIEFPIAAGLALGSVSIALPHLRAQADASKLRVAFRHALSAYLDLVSIALAGGAGVDSALRDSAAIGRGRAFEQIRHALEAARLTRTTPWANLRDLAEQMAVPELAELAASISLAGSEGAKIRASLGAKATALRLRQLIDAEGAAQAATERMSLPVALLLLGFFLFLTYPALTQVLNGL